MTKEEFEQKGRAVTLEDVKALDSSVKCLTPLHVANLLGGDPQQIRVCARKYPEKLGYPVCVLGSRVKIPIPGFIRFMEGLL